MTWAGTVTDWNERWLLQPGMTLPNGATLIASRTVGDRVIVLGYAGDDYVTWSAIWHGGLLTSWGHYFGDDLRAAVDDFYGRA